MARIVRGTQGDDRLNTHSPETVRVYGYRGNDIIDMSERGAGGYGGMGNDTFFGGGPGVRQSHMYGGPGHDTFYLNTGNNEAPYGDHVWGDEASDQFHFTTEPGDTARITGRIDDFDHSRDTIWLNGTQLDLQNLPPNVRIVQQFSQPWILIDERILYALEGARQYEGAIDANLDNGPEEIAFGNGETEEAHFIDWPQSWANGVPESANLPYHDFHAYFPRYNYQGPVNDWELPTNNFTDDGDLVRGTDAAERLLGDDGSDTLYGAGGNDLIQGGEFDDSLYGGEGDDSISGGLDNDLIEGGNGNDWVYGGSGQDTIMGGAGHDQLYGNNGFDIIDGGDGNDTIHGGWNDDTLYGGRGNDLIYAAFPEVFEDHPDGQSAQLFGGEGRDTLHAEVDGDAYMRGGAGHDQYVMYEGANVTIADFQPNFDYLDLNGLSPGPERINENLSEQQRADGNTDMVLSLGVLGTLTFQGMSEASRSAILASIGQEGPIDPTLPPIGPVDPGEDDDDDDDGEPGDDDDEEEEEEAGASDGSCFVATACFGGAAHPDVAWLRQFRNQVLRRSVLGRVFIATYWQVGPILAKGVHHQSRSGRVMRKILGRLVTFGRKRFPNVIMPPKIAKVDIKR